jgi:DNA mismatch repair protein MSH2
MFSKISKEETDEGTLIVEDFLRTWKTRVEAARASGEGDVPMVPKEEEQMEMLKSVVAEYKGKFDGNAWVKAVLENL